MTHTPQFITIYFLVEVNYDLCRELLNWLTSWLPHQILSISPESFYTLFLKLYNETKINNRILYKVYFSENLFSELSAVSYNIRS